MRAQRRLIALAALILSACGASPAPEPCVDPVVIDGEETRDTLPDLAPDAPRRVDG